MASVPWRSDTGTRARWLIRMVCGSDDLRPNGPTGCGVGSGICQMNLIYGSNWHLQVGSILTKQVATGPH